MIKRYYILIIIITVVFIVLILALDAYYTYLNAAKLETTVKKTQNNVTLASKVVCDPILSGTIGEFATITDEAIAHCREVGAE